MPTTINNNTPYVVLTRTLVLAGVFPSRNDGAGGGIGVTLGALRHYAFNFAPRDTALAVGQLLPISQNTAVFSLIGTTYGGNGTTTFQLPNLIGARSTASGQGPGLSLRDWGSFYGDSTIDLLQSNLPANMGGTSAPIDNNALTLTTNYYINAVGIFPSNTLTADSIGVITEFAGNFGPNGAIPCDGRLLQISEFDALFQLIGTTYGGDGTSTFAVPDLRGRTIIGTGQGPGLSNYVLGQTGGGETATVGPNNIPNAFGSTLGQPISNAQPYIALNHYITLQGIFPSQNGEPDKPMDPAADNSMPFLGEVLIFAGTLSSPNGVALANGQLLPINQNQALFSLLGTNFGGNGTTNFALPDLRGRTVLGSGSNANGSFTVGQTGGTETFSLLGSDIPDLNFSGTPGNDRLLSGDGNDTINGLDGNDTLISLSGTDTLNGNAGNDILIGGNGNDSLDGGADNDVLVGGDGFDTLTGGLGTNELYGGFGNDIYVVSNAADTIVELLNQGTDLVQTGVSVYTLPNNVEDLTYTGLGNFVGVGNALGNTITGGNGFNALVGGDGNDTIVGGTTASELIGGTGNDSYVVSNAGDTIVENAGEGTDTVLTGIASYTLRTNLENLTYTGTGSFTGVGNAANNVIIGGAGADVLVGSSGNDTLTGGGGIDRFFYAGGETGIDTITDFTSGIDKIVLSATGFTRTATVQLLQGAAAALVPTNGNSVFLYDNAAGVLSYDPDGNGAASAIVLANIGPGKTLTLSDFIFF